MWVRHEEPSPCGITQNVTAVDPHQAFLAGVWWDTWPRGDKLERAGLVRGEGERKEPAMGTHLIAGHKVRGCFIGRLHGDELANDSIEEALEVPEDRPRDCELRTRRGRVTGSASRLNPDDEEARSCQDCEAYS